MTTQDAPDLAEVCKDFAAAAEAAGESLRNGLMKIFRRVRVNELINLERNRQDDKWGWPNAGLAGTDDAKKFAILGEEVGEVANAFLEGDRANMHAELVQVAAVCVAWLESEIEGGRLK